MSFMCISAEPYHVKIVDIVTSDESKKYAPAGRMAEAIIGITKKSGDCLPKDLIAKGFTHEEIAAQGHMAQSLANVELKLMDNKKTNPLFWWRKR